MGGMCLGSLVLPRLVGAHHHPLRLYAYLELGIGAFGIIVLYAVPVIGGIYTEWAGTGTTSLILRAVVASICLLPPTFLMGATLPVVARGVEATPSGVSWLGYFYGGNLVGAVSGSLVAGYVPAARLRHADHDDGCGGAQRAGGRHRARAGAHHGVPAGRGHRGPAHRDRPAGGLRGHRAVGHDGPWGRGGVDASVVAALWRDDVYVFTNPRGVPDGAGAWQFDRLAGRRALPPIARRAGRVPITTMRRNRLGRVHDERIAPVLADQSGDRQEPGLPVRSGSAAIAVGDSARLDALGRQLSAGHQRGCAKGTGHGATRRRRLCRQHGGRDRRRAGNEPGARGDLRQPGGAASADRGVGAVGAADAHQRRKRAGTAPESADCRDGVRRRGGRRAHAYGAAASGHPRRVTAAMQPRGSASTKSSTRAKA